MEEINYPEKAMFMLTNQRDHEKKRGKQTDIEMYTHTHTHTHTHKTDRQSIF
jgi:hypothetical protein